MQAFPRPSVAAVVQIFLTIENTAVDREVQLTNATVGL
jgi:hypothetical protein